MLVVEHASLTVPHVIVPLHIGVPETATMVDVATHVYPLKIHEPEHVALESVRVSVSEPPEFRLKVSVYVVAPTVVALVHDPTIGLLLPLLHPHPSAAIAVHTGNPPLRIIEWPSSRKTRSLVPQDHHAIVCSRNRPRHADPRAPVERRMVAEYAASAMTDEQRRERALAEILVQSSVDGLFAVDHESRYTLWNSAMERFAGKRADEVLGKYVFDVFPFLRELGLDRALDRALAGETVRGEAIPNVIPNGEVHYFDRYYSPLRDSENTVVGVAGVLRDVTAKRDAEEALRSSEDKLRMAAETSGVGLWSWDTQTDAVTWDAALCTLFSIPQQAIPKGRAAYLSLVHPDDRARADAVITAGVAAGGWEGEHRMVRSDGAVRWVITKGTVSHRDGRAIALGAIVDVTDRRHRDEQIRQAQKLEAVGQLTAGIAHNFNNILMALLANLELAAKAAPADMSRSSRRPDSRPRAPPTSSGSSWRSRGATA